MSNNNGLLAVRPQGLLTGFGNLLRKENQAWWGTRRWLVQAALWTIILNGLVAVMLFVLPNLTTPEGQPAIEDDPIMMGIQGFFAVGSMALSIGIIILTQDMVIGEKESGTAAWILSKPVSRTAFILSKLAANAIGILVILIALQAAIAYGLLALANGGPLPLPHFLAGVGLVVLQGLFYLTLTLVMGVVADNRGMVLGVALGVLLGGTLLRNVPVLALATPWALPDVAALVATGQPLPMMFITPVVLTAVWSLIFAFVAVWRFQQLEF